MHPARYLKNGADLYLAFDKPDFLAIEIVPIQALRGASGVQMRHQGNQTRCNICRCHCASHRLNPLIALIRVRFDSKGVLRKRQRSLG